MRLHSGIACHLELSQKFQSSLTLRERSRIKVSINKLEAERVQILHCLCEGKHHACDGTFDGGFDQYGG